MKKLTYIIIVFYLLGCNDNSEPIIVSTEDLHQSIQKVTDIMVHDIFSPPVASRIFAYPNIAAYEIMALNNEDYTSLAGQVTDLTPIPQPAAEATINYELSALIAHMELGRRLIFSEETLVTFRDSLYQKWNKKNPKLFNASKDYGLQVSEHIAQWMSKDNYNQTRTMQKFTVDTDDPSRWQPTPPGYMDGIEPHWGKIRPFVLDSANQFTPSSPPPFSMEKDSEFYKEVVEVYEISKEITAKGDDSEEIAMAKFWDCNPYVSVTRGHLMFATKKISPGAHWMGITKIASKKAESDFAKTIYAYTKTSIAIADAFISCWDEKYRSNLIRPETLINQYLDENWLPILQTPPFPEYTSGHSVVSGAASIALTEIFGDDFSFDDDTEVPYGLPIRSFNSFKHAAEEAAMSRLYGGIHYRSAIELGIKQGKDLGNFVVDKLSMTKPNELASNKQ
ncbi:vanadium-dependent haloperoxidase [Arenibacter latericius]|uniref:vanadium-dependent haloperoxidase n=1 Tax=Arenibacter latericius TaxID=86104 RepID=UPI0003F75598|nr:vanadium-dependent haloperoxidase [Arenibacter latericius]